MARSSERGQTSASYLGQILVVAAVVAAVLAIGVPLAVSGGLDRAVCAIIRHESCGNGTPGRNAVEGDDPRTPLDQATGGTYVGIGDSFSSGEGAYDYESESDTEENRCHRSANAYARELAGDLDFEGGTNFVACSGAKARNVLSKGQNGEDAQIEAIDDETSLVTLGIGGNDADWVPVIKACFLEGEAGCLATEEETDARLDAAADKVFEVYLEAKERAPDGARIVAVGYPRFFPDPATEDQYAVSLGGCTPLGCPYKSTWSITPAEQDYMNRKTRRFNDLLAEKAEEAGIEFVDLNDAFEGHEFGTEDSYFNGVKLKTPRAGTDMGEMLASAIGAETSHPNAKGQKAMAEAVRQQVEHP